MSAKPKKGPGRYPVEPPTRVLLDTYRLKADAKPKLKKGDVFESRALDWRDKPLVLTVVRATVRGRPGEVLVDSENVTESTVWRVYVKRTSLLDPRRYTRREAAP